MNSSRRNSLLLAINQLAATDSDELINRDRLLEKCCEIILKNKEYCLVWAGTRDDNGSAITPLVALTSADIPRPDCMMSLVEQVLTGFNENVPAAKALLTGHYTVCQDVCNSIEFMALRDIAMRTGFRSCSAWPLIYKGKEFGVLSIHSEKINCFTDDEITFLKTMAGDISLALYSQEVTLQMQVERDFNREIVDTMEALLISVSPCGNILSFNHTAEVVTGYKEKDVVGHYWVDILMSPEHRQSNQKLFSNVFKGDEERINFESYLLTMDGQHKCIEWHASFRQNIEQGKVGLVLFGIDITGKILAGQHLNRAIAQWENIFSAIQDPALIVSNNGIILDANPATFTASRKTEEEVIGHSACSILHLGRQQGTSCPLEELIQTRQSRIIETELRGFHGNYLLTVSPLKMNDNKEKVSLLVARDLTEEEQMKAEAIRSAQLASVGELAAGVAHEINNPINGIINYAQIILDDPPDSDTPDRLQRIIKEGKRVASIVSNLLDFSRRREESPEDVSIQKIVSSCTELVNHQFKKDCILLTLNLPHDLPLVHCNAQQIQQVILNVFSNARYALNKKYTAQNPDKMITLTGETVGKDASRYLRLTITDQGTGIESHLIERLFDPFFSTKPKGEGTGLGLSISHGLIHDNNGTLRIKSVLGVFTTIIIEIPVSQN